MDSERKKIGEQRNEADEGKDFQKFPSAKDQNCECHCSGPPPKFHLPPPPNLSPPSGPFCSKYFDFDFPSTLDPVNHCSTSAPISGVILMVVIVSVVIFLFVGVTLVQLKKKQTQLHRKPSERSSGDPGTLNEIIYENLKDVGSRACSSDPVSSEMPIFSPGMISSIFISNDSLNSEFFCKSSTMSPTGNCQNQINPIYEELSDGSVENMESKSEKPPLLFLANELGENETQMSKTKEELSEEENQLQNGPSKNSIIKCFTKEVDWFDFIDDKSIFLVDLDHTENEEKTTTESLFCDYSKMQVLCKRKRNRRNKSKIPKRPSSIAERRKT